MVLRRDTSLPHVLTEYLPDNHAEDFSGGEEEDYHDEEPKVKVRGSKSLHRGAPRAPSRERTQERIKQQQKRERNERQYETWQEVKAIYRDEQTREFRKKSSLQKQLITTRDNLRQIRQREQQEEQAKIREADRAAKYAQTSQLEQICRESLETDRQRSLERKRAARQLRHQVANSETSTTSHHAGSPRYSPADGAGAAGSSQEATQMGDATLRRRGSDEVYPRDITARFGPRGVSDLSTHSSLASGPLHRIAGGRVPGTPLYEEDDVDEDGSPVMPGSRGNTGEASEQEALPWHQEQLYRLYGKAAADEFLFPRFEEKKRSNAPKITNPKLRRQGVNARDLWNDLRNDSRMKLLKEDSNIAPELKFAYSAFVRQILQRRRAPVKRNFYDKEDVPDLELLMDQSRIRNAQDYRHKCELMYRSSHMNEDKNRVLMFNNPPPDLNNWAGAESCDRYMPSWAEEAQSDISSEKSYKKWLGESRGRPAAGAQQLLAVQEQEDREFGAQPVEEEPPGKQHEEYGDSNADFPVAQHRPRLPQKSQFKLSFLTEKGARCAGQFSARHRQGEEMKNIPSAHKDSQNLVSQSAMAMLGNSSSRSDSRATGSLRSRRSTLRRSQSEMHSGQYSSAWQPLSLGALIEYKHKVPTLGQGDFALGKTPMWKTETV